MAHYDCDHCGASPYDEECKCDLPNEEYRAYLSKKINFMRESQYINYRKVDEELEKLFVALHDEPPEKTYLYR